jgi:hypothetical protein
LSIIVQLHVDGFSFIAKRHISMDPTLAQAMNEELCIQINTCARANRHGYILTE